MSTIRTGSTSRLRFYDFVLIDGYEFWGLPDPPAIEEQSDDQYYQVRTGDRIDTLAFRFYGDAVLWWVIAQANGMELLPSDLNEGAILKIPSPRYVGAVLFTSAKF